MMLKKLNKKAFPFPGRTGGFTVMETIMGFTLLSLAIAGFSGMIVSSLRGFRMSQEKYVAAKIAQDGIELALNKKDNHVQCVSADPTCPIATWQTNLLGNFEVEASNPTELRPNGVFATYNPLAPRVICMMNMPPNRGKFGYGGGGCNPLPSNYTREVVISAINSYNVRIQSIVRWTGGKSLMLEGVFFSR